MKTSKFTKEKSSMGTSTMTATIQQPGPVSAPSTPSYGPRQTGDSVTFTASYPKAAVVQIAGDFNNWQPEKTPMRKTANGAWQAKITVAKGSYHYRMVVDGQWQQDPHNSNVSPNPYGGLNSLLEVR